MQKKMRKVRRCKHNDRNDCVLNDAEFAKRVQALAAKLVHNQLEIARLVHAYVTEHGNHYGKKVYEHIAEITGLAVRTVNHYYELYCLRTEFKDLATLPNFSLSKQYEIARLFKYPETKTAIPELIKQTEINCMRTVDVELHVDKLLKEAGRFKHRKPKPEKPLAPAPSADPQGNGGDGNEKPPLVFGPDDEENLRQATAGLELAAKQDTKLAVNMADHRLVVCNLCHNLSKYLWRLVEQGDGYALAPTINRVVKELIELNQKIAAAAGFPRRTEEVA